METSQIDAGVLHLDRLPDSENSLITLKFIMEYLDYVWLMSTPTLQVYRIEKDTH